ncbi:AMP-binding protein (plasmid) [Rhizobium sp. NIBRBAC000502774]|nr:AMP-binding protein [Rhizobium sp. NIBRBAC000502774]
MSAAIRLRGIFARFEDFPGLCYRQTDGDLRFSDLHRRVLSLMRMIAAAGIASQTRRPMLILGHKNHRYLIGYWACLLSGRALVPIEPETPVERIRQIATSCGACAVLVAEPDTSQRIVATLPVDVPVIRIGGSGEVDDKYPSPQDVLDSVAVDNSDVAYIMFSSGTLGQPKGIQVTYSNLVDFIGWLEVLFPDAAAFRAVSGNIRYCFDVSLFELWSSWLQRVPITALDHADLTDSTGYIQRMANDHVSLWVSTPSITRLFLKNRRFRSDFLPSCKTFLFCGEPLTKQIVGELFERFPACRVINTYGPTECTVAVTSVDIDIAHLNSDHALPIGYAREGTYLEHPSGAEGDPTQGEILIRGLSVGRGYIGLDAKQKAAFPEPSLYRTGDWGWKADDGLWYFKGRIDREVKIQGVRISLDDVETHIRSQPGIDDVLVNVFEVEGQPRALNAFILGSPTADDLRGLAYKMAGELPHYLVPRFWYAGFDLKLNNNSKLDRQTVLAASAQARIRYVHSQLIGS